MLVVLASAHDAAAQAIVAAWAPWGAALCTPADLSLPGWRHGIGAPEAAVIAGHVLPAQAITGMLTRLAAVQPEELTHIASTDRSYVAAEMTAFLTAFITALPGKVVNRPSAGSLCGPAWHPEQWIRTAAEAGIPVCTRQRSIRPGAPAEPRVEVAAEITVIGDRVLGAADARLADWARSLARAAGVELLGLGFARQARGYALASVDPLPRLDTPERLAAARDALLGGADESRR